MATLISLVQVAVIVVLACYSYVLGVRRGRRRREAEVAALRDLVQHAWLHTNYRNCGYSHMTTEQKALFDAVTGQRAA